MLSLFTNACADVQSLDFTYLPGSRFLTIGLSVIPNANGNGNNWGPLSLNDCVLLCLQLDACQATYYAVKSPFKQIPAQVTRGTSVVHHRTSHCLFTAVPVDVLYTPYNT